MSVLAGLRAKDGYLFFIDDLTGGPLNNSGIVKLSKYCGALILTSNGEQLKRLQQVLDKCIKDKIHENDDLSDDLVKRIILFLKTEFHNDPSYKSIPLTFLLLVIGTDRTRQEHLEHVYIRHRVKETIERNGEREFITVFDIESPIPAGDIFYGNSNIIEYLAKRLSCSTHSVEVVKLLACLSVADFDKNDPSSINRIRMASLSQDKGFDWIENRELSSLTEEAGEVNFELEKGLNSYVSGKI